MNSALNMKLVEQFLLADDQQSNTLMSVCNRFHETLTTQIEGYSGLALYQQENEEWVVTYQIPEDATLTLSMKNVYPSLFADNTDYKINEDSIYLRFKMPDTLTILNLMMSNPSQTDIHWTVIHKLLLKDFHDVSSGGSTVDEKSQMHQALYELATFASTNQDEKRLLDKGATTLLDVVKVDHVGIMLADEDQQFLTLISDAPELNIEIPKIPIDEKNWSILQRGENIFIENIRTDTQTYTESKQVLETVNVQSVMIMPLRDVSGKVLGSVGLDKYQGTLELTNEQLRTAELINVQLASQLQNLRLLNNSQRLANQMQQIAKFGETVQSRLDIAEVLETSLHFAKRIFDVNYINIVLYDDIQQHFIINALYQGDEDVILPEDNNVIPIENTIIGQVWQTRDSKYVKSFDQSDYNKHQSKDLKTVYAVALNSRGVMRGVIEIGRQTDRDIASIDRNVVSQFANLLAVALENVTNYAKNQRIAQNKSLANEIALQLQQQVDMDSLLNATVTELGKALGAKRAKIRLGVHQALNNKN